jgi:hypothetical protein
MTAGQSNVSKHRSTTPVAWSPAPPKKKKKKTESLIERLKRQKEEKEKLIDMM